MKKLIIIGGLPGVGKSYICRLLIKRLKNCLYFDSDLFSKDYIGEKKIDFLNWLDEEQQGQRLIFHRAKIDKIIDDLKNYDTILLDTCFDLPPSRRMFYKFAKENDIRLVVVEVRCAEETVKQRIFEMRHETERMIGDKKSRWDVYEKMKAAWVPIENADFIIESDKDLNGQLDKLVEKLAS